MGDISLEEIKNENVDLVSIRCPCFSHHPNGGNVNVINVCM